MRLEIDYKQITDSPYKRGAASFFSFTKIEVENFTNLISNMNESSYYVSGFRGVGKTSFIKKVEEELTKTGDVVFVHVPIAKYDNYEVLIRGFIRQCFFQFVENKAYKNFKSSQEIINLVESLDELNKQTFSKIEIEKFNEKKAVGEREIVKVSLKEEILFFLAGILTVVLFTIDFGAAENYKIIAQFVSIGVTIVQALKFNNTIKKNKSSTKRKSETEKSFYDDEIAEYRFNNLLKDFKSIGIKPIFIIDELDKLSISEAKKVLYLFKSTLLSGYANFIVIGGQDLYYELYTAKDSEDHILSTLFSKTFHIPLKSSYELRDLFEKLILNKESIVTDEQKAAYNQFVNCLVLESKKIPRKFVNLIKDELFFEKERAFIDIPEEYARPAHSELLLALDKVCDEIESHPMPIKDYIILKLFGELDNILRLKTQAELDNYIQNIE